MNEHSEVFDFEEGEIVGNALHVPDQVYIAAVGSEEGATLIALEDTDESAEDGISGRHLVVNASKSTVILDLHTTYADDANRVAFDYRANVEGLEATVFYMKGRKLEKESFDLINGGAHFDQAVDGAISRCQIIFYVRNGSSRGEGPQFLLDNLQFSKAGDNEK